MTRLTPYDVHEVEEKWRTRWAAAGCFEARDSSSRPKFYNFDGGPFPNGPLHMGHVRTFTLGDVTARYMRMRGSNVLYCFEFDAFGLPNELAAEASGISPEQLTRSHIHLMRGQMERLGLSYDWSHVHVTCDPQYYRWTQWLFLRLVDRGLVYRALAPLNYCTSCETTLAHMQVDEGRCWRCDSSVEQRELSQWFVRLSAYNDVLAETLPGLDGWSRQVRRMLNGFIGRTEGFDVDFEVSSPAERRGTTITAFANDLQSLQNAPHLLVAPGAGQIEECLGKEQAARLQHGPPPATRRRRTARGAGRSDGDRAHDALALDTGIRVRHPIHGRELAVLASELVDPWFANGIVIGTRSEQAAPPPAAPRVTEAELGDAVRRVVYYRIHDWLVSRQRRWGTPIPIIICGQCGDVPVPDEHLPVPLAPAETSATPPHGEAVAGRDGPRRVNCPRCGSAAMRETDTLDCYFDVVWCFLACSTRLDGSFRFRRDDFRAWNPVDRFHNGVDSFFYAHLYRFLGRVLHEMGILDDPEPIHSYHGHGTVLIHGKKMSKHHGTAVAPDSILEKFGADIVRLSILWSASPLKNIEWVESSVDDAERLLSRIWSLIAPRAAAIHQALDESGQTTGPGGKLPRLVARTARRLTVFVERYQMSGCIEELHLLTTRLTQFAHDNSLGTGTIEWAPSESGHQFSRAARTLVLLLAPFCPFLAEELWERIGEPGFVALAEWPGNAQESRNETS